MGAEKGCVSLLFYLNIQKGRELRKNIPTNGENFDPCRKNLQKNSLGQYTISKIWERLTGVEWLAGQEEDEWIVKAFTSPSTPIHQFKSQSTSLNPHEACIGFGKVSEHAWTFATVQGAHVIWRCCKILSSGFEQKFWCRGLKILNSKPVWRSQIWIQVTSKSHDSRKFQKKTFS